MSEYVTLEVLVRGWVTVSMTAEQKQKLVSLVDERVVPLIEVPGLEAVHLAGLPGYVVQVDT